MARNKVIYDINQITDKAFQIVNEEGEDSFSIRRLSKELNVSSMTLYNYVENLENIKKEVVIKGFNIFYREVFTAMNGFRISNEEGVASACEIIAGILYQFAVDYPGIFLLIYGRSMGGFKKDIEIRPFYKLFNQLFRRLKISEKERDAYRIVFKLLEYVIQGILCGCLQENKMISKEEYLSYIHLYLQRMMKI